jgi:hypothetical protein
MNQYVIYNNPKDYPGKFVVRQWIIGPGTVHSGELICIASTIEEARAKMPHGVEQLPVFESDDPVIAEVWMDGGKVEENQRRSSSFTRPSEYDFSRLYRNN